MAQPAREATPQFSQPVRQISLMLIVLALSCLGAFIALPRVLPIFEANPYLNGFIIFVFFIGVLACFYQVFQLIGSVKWIERFAADHGNSGAVPPPLLAPLASLLRTRGARMQVGASSTRSILESVATRIDEAREITRYIVNLLIFLGLLGTFYGLATTVPAVVDTIRSLAPQDGEESVDVFNRLMTGLEAQLGGMGVAFASSLLGLAGSLVVGLLELFAGHGQNRFYQELEDWLSSITRVGFSSGEEAGGEQGGALAAVVDHMAEQMEALQVMFARSDDSRAGVDGRIGALAEAVERMTAKLGRKDGSQAALEKIADGQERVIAALESQGGDDVDGRIGALAEAVERMTSTLGRKDDSRAALEKIAEGQERVVAALEGHDGGEGMDAESRMRLRSIDVQMLRILEEISAGRQESMAELRKDMSKLTRALTPPRRPDEEER
ncbi:biopolymer transporter ExbB [Sulfitobacter sp. SK012]|uniref:biopolymer transporter ExbB n=1 Tax=Sulfitobacter sp. SK012 TaxID=1389005 RepID=UPI000E0B7849|nr:biopolymer transporter ExbB [Sulfitobacter sp. SK012]AXI45343.1 biopolymer transporter ExbB [Sulfitobacter sp. SK012]